MNVDSLAYAFRVEHGVRLCINGVHSEVCNRCERYDINRHLDKDDFAAVVAWLGSAKRGGGFRESSPSSVTLKRKISAALGKPVSNLSVILAAVQLGMPMQLMGASNVTLPILGAWVSQQPSTVDSAR